MLTELQNRGPKDILIACVDGLKGFPDAIYTTHAVESVNSVIRKATKKRKLFPHDYSAKKGGGYLTIDQYRKKWMTPIRNWKPALNRFMIEYEDRLKGII